MQVVLISTYELGHQPFGLASPAAWLRAEGAEVACLDLFIQRLDAAQSAIASADLLALYLPMHTATRIAAAALPRLRQLNPQAHICCYGLYAPLNAALLQSLGAQTIIGGEFEQPLVALYQQLRAKQQPGFSNSVALARQQFLLPARQDLPPLARYAHLHGLGQPRVVGYTEASRGCKHRCRHCPVVPVYQGSFRVVQPEVVLDDIAQQVAAGAEHITFGDPDFFNGPTHAMRIVRALHDRFPQLTFDATIKIEHLLAQAQYLPELRACGCVLITSAVESVDDAILHLLAKGHSRADFVRAVALVREAGIALQPTFVAFNPWITRAGYCELLAQLDALDLVEHVPSIQLAIRLLIPAGSPLLDMPALQPLLGTFDPAALCYPWQHPDPGVDALQQAVLAAVKAGEARGDGRRAIFEAVWKLAHAAVGQNTRLAARRYPLANRPIPFLSEPWYC